MKRIVSFLLFTCLFFKVHSQPGMPGFDSLYRDFNTAYHDKRFEGTPSNYFDKLRYASLSVFNTDNEDYIAMIMELQKVKNIGNPITASEMIIDSVIYKFTKKDIWTFNQSLFLIKFHNALSFINQITCDCVTKNSGADEIPGDRMDEIVQQTCGTELLKDTATLNKLRSLFGRSSIREGAEAESMVPQYIFINCPITKKTLLTNIKDETHDRLSYGLDNYASELGELATKAFGEKNQPFLTRIFPEYKKFTIALGKAYSSSKPIRYGYHTEVKELKTGGATFTLTFYSYNYKSRKATLKYQIAYTTDKKDLSSKILNFTFIPVEKIANKQKLLKILEEQDLVEPPPPPQEMLQQ